MTGVLAAKTASYKWLLGMDSGYGVLAMAAKSEAEK
jgi:hypothetical protein